MTNPPWKKPRFPFAEQDFLNEFFAGKTLLLPAGFNALKYAFQNPKHRDLLSLDTCQVVHFVQTKPWERLAKHEEDEFGPLFEAWRKAFLRLAPTCFQRPQWSNHLVNPGLSSLWYVPNFISEKTEERLLEEIYGERLRGRWRELQSRGVLCLGGAPHPDGALLEALDGSILDLAAALQEVNATAGMSNQCFINSYAPGQGIDAHFDGPRFRSQVAIVSLESAALLRFTLVDKRERPDLPHRIPILLQPRSLVVFNDEAYELYVHCVPRELEDVCPKTGEVVPRTGRRTSLTFRQLANVQCTSDVVNNSSALQEHRADQWKWWDSQLSEID